MPIRSSKCNLCGTVAISPVFFLLFFQCRLWDESPRGNGLVIQASSFLFFLSSSSSPSSSASPPPRCPLDISPQSATREGHPMSCNGSRLPAVSSEVKYGCGCDAVTASYSGCECFITTAVNATIAPMERERGLFPQEGGFASIASPCPKQPRM
ncbi:hypothetical protein LX36DRAFT_269984 [Colletotrichum falcatum]|nr:hypothetical protein LX36DRAFT_269984 [Colletotrichum falcatum]